MTYSIIPKTLPILIALFLIGSLLYGQKTEIRVNACSGLSYFRGSGSTSATTGYPNLYGVYGRKPGLSYSFGLQVQQVTRQKHLFGLGIGFEKLRSKAKTKLFATDIIDGETPAPPETGTTTLSTSYITLNTFIGQRLLKKAFTIDASAAIDFAYSLKSRFGITKFTSSWSDDSYSFEKNEITPRVDIRPGVQISVNYKHYSLIAGYSIGLTGYSLKMPGFETRSPAYTNFLRMGISLHIR